MNAQHDKWAMEVNPQSFLLLYRPQSGACPQASRCQTGGARFILPGLGLATLLMALVITPSRILT